MDGLIAFLGLLSVAATVVSLICLIKPIRWLGLSTRSRAFVALAGFFCLMLILMSITPTSTTKQEVAQQKEVVDQSRQATTASVTAARSEPRATPAKAKKPEPRPDLELLDGWQYTTKQFNQVITGRIRNNTGRRYSYVQVTFDVFDSQGSRVGNAMANINNLGPGEVWKFEAMNFGTEGARARLGDITGF